MCGFGSIWCHGDIVECRVTGLGKGNVLASREGGHAYGILFHISRGEREVCPQSAFLCHSVSRSILDLKHCLGVSLWHRMTHIMLRWAGPSPWCPSFPKIPVIEKTIPRSKNGKYTADYFYSPLCLRQTLPINDSFPQITHTATTSGFQSKHIR